MHFHKNLKATCVDMVSLCRWRVPCINPAIFLQTTIVLLANLSRSVVHMRQSDSSICLNLHMLPIERRYGVPQNPSYITSRRTGNWVCHPSCYLHQSIAAIQSWEGSQMQRWPLTHTAEHWLWNALREALRTGQVVQRSSAGRWSRDSNIHSHTQLL